MIKKYKKLPLILCGLAGVALLTTGFSTWVLSGVESTVSDQSVDVTVGKVEDNRVNLSLVKAENALVFDANKVGTNAIKGDGEKEDLQISGQLKLAFVNNADITAGTTLKSIVSGFTFTFTSNNKAYDDAVTNNLILEPFLKKTMDYTFNTPGTTTVNHDATGYLKTEFAYAEQADFGTLTLDYKIGFCWGTAFKKKNPVDIDFAGADNDMDIGTVIGHLKTLQKMNGTNVLSLKITPKTAA